MTVTTAPGTSERGPVSHYMKLHIPHAYLHKGIKKDGGISRRLVYLFILLCHKVIARRIKPPIHYAVSLPSAPYVPDPLLLFLTASRTSPAR